MITFETDGHALTVSCRCKVCKINAEHLGLPVPLKATVATPQGRKLSEQQGGKHAIVYAAHSKSPIEAAMRDRYVIEPA